jgi:prepilin-type N-terminal cleavage/methylation domain-containing protein
MKYSSARLAGFTLIELLIVISLLAIITIGSITAFTTARNKQLVRQSAEMVADTFQRASIYSQNARNERTWGVKSEDTLGYVIISQETGGSEFVEPQAVPLPRGIRFSDPFHILFTRGTGNVDTDTQVVLQASTDITSVVSLTTTGKITVTTP